MGRMTSCAASTTPKRWAVFSARAHGSCRSGCSPSPPPRSRCGACGSARSGSRPRSARAASACATSSRASAPSLSSAGRRSRSARTSWARRRRRRSGRCRWRTLRLTARTRGPSFVRTSAGTATSHPRCCWRGWGTGRRREKREKREEEEERRRMVRGICRRRRLRFCFGKSRPSPSQRRRSVRCTEPSRTREWSSPSKCSAPTFSRSWRRISTS
mmetsp:Transcript_921/g.3455  ORF Transcript_921/g.3455 Transcript_921/m.3455 type:complete len:215 (-) Transcript_921:2185-2829(-)